MNQDLDSRILPNGEYREAINLSISRSEGSTVGEFENILGNEKIFQTDSSAVIIGNHVDKTNNRVFIFATDNTASSVYNKNANNYIYEISLSGVYTKKVLVKGAFLNFSQSFPITGTNLIEDLLFFTDNLNQPRKINIDLANPTSAANPTHYTSEDQISVAKYAPCEPLIAIDRIVTKAAGAQTGVTTLAIDSSAGIKPGDAVFPLNTITVPTGFDNRIYVVAVNPGKTIGSPAGTPNTVTLSSSLTVADDEDISFTRSTATNKTNELNSNGVIVGAAYTTSGAAGINQVYEVNLPASNFEASVIPKIGDIVTLKNSTGTTSYFFEGTTIVSAVATAMTADQCSWELKLSNAVNNTGSAVPAGQVLKLSVNPDYDPLWSQANSDSNFLEDKFIRFSYRFKFEDNEYSLMAPFTQPIYIPKQLGHFGGGTASLTDDMDDTYKSTIVAWFENNVQNILLKIPLPYNTLQNNINNLLINEVDILYKESDALAVKVLSSLNISNLPNPTTTLEFIKWADPVHGITDTYYYPYNYASSKPYKTLPNRDTVRVYDKVPVKALSQEVIGNRVVYGNYIDKHSSPAGLNYSALVKDRDGYSVNTVEYPTHTLKQNRTYQVGFVLSDYYGRQSDVILSSVDATTEIDASTGVVYGGSTVYAPYHVNNTNPSVKNWFGDALTLVLNSGIESGNNGNPSTSDITSGQPGLYANPIASGFNIAGVTPIINSAMTVPVLGGDGFMYQFTLNGGVSTGVPIVGSFLRGKYTDYVEVVEIGIASTVYSVFTRKPINESFYSLTTPATTPDNQFAFTINPEGWYSYKIVVKQTEQDYYNVYLPGILAGYPGQPLPTTTTENQAITNSYSWDIVNGNNCIQVGMLADGAGASNSITGNPSIVQRIDSIHYVLSSEQTVSANSATTYRMPGELSLFPSGEIGKTANIVLINDNINKVPRDLAEVGPDQKQFRSSVQLFGRVTNNTTNSNVQYFPGTSTDTVVSISTANDSNFKLNTILEQNYTNIYQLDTNPLIARLETTTKKSTTGVTQGNSGGGLNATWNIATAPTVPVEVNMIITNNDPTSDDYQIVYGYVIEVLSTTSFKVNASVPNVQALPTGTAIKFTLTIGVPSGRNRSSSVGGNLSIMEPFLAIYETEPTESLLDIFWETNTIGLIADLNKDVSSGFDGAIGWSSHTWTQSENLAAQTVIITGLFPLNASGSNLTNTSISNFTATNSNGTAVPIILEKDLTAGNGSYRVRLNDTFVFLNDASLRNFTLQATITNLATTPTIPAIISLSGSLSNAAPVFTTSNQTVSQTFTGVITTLTGVNGSARTSSNTQQLKWSISGTGSQYFSIGETTGILSKTNSNTPAANYTLAVKLEDTWNGSSVANPGVKSLTVSQQIVVNNSVVGFAFSASGFTNAPGVCPFNGSLNADCGSTIYYNRTTNSGTPNVGDEIATGPNANSPTALIGFYSYNCGQASPPDNRRFYQLDANGIVLRRDTCGNI